MLTTKTDSFVNVSEITTKIARQLFDDTKQISGKTKLLKAVNHPANSGGLQKLKMNYNF